LSKISPAGYRFPEPFAGVQVNFCKNIKCEAFGVPETLNRIRRPKGTSSEAGDYIRSGDSRGNIRMVCGLCGSKNPLRSNQAIAQELGRLSAHIFDSSAPCCPLEACSSHGVPVSTPGFYVRNGKTPSGTPRWRCNACRKTFAGKAAPQARQRKPHKNRDVFSLLMNKMPLNRIAEVTGLAPTSIYGKIALIHRQCMAFAGRREQQLVQGMALPCMYVAVDRQVHNVNWSNRRDRRNVALTAIGSADLVSGYVFGFNLNFDPSMDANAVEKEAAANGDLAEYEAYRQYARVWLSTDYEASVEASKTRRSKAKKLKTAAFEEGLEQDITAQYAQSQAREDIEAEEVDTDTALPSQGVQIKDQYTMHGHFHLLATLLRNAEKVRCYMDQDSGMRAAFLGAFAERVKQRSADAWFVSVMKDATVTQKESAVSKAKARLAEAYAANQGLPLDAVKLLLMKEEMANPKEIGEFGDAWLSHPVPNMSEPAKKMCRLTDLGDYDEDHRAHLYLKSSLHAVDRFFMQARRRLSLAERSILTASAARRTWYGYSAYSPENLANVLEVFRVFYNYCKVGDDKQTPAMRLGLAKTPIALEQVLYFEGDSGITRSNKKVVPTTGTTFNQAQLEP
jgi:transposase-like protein